MPCQSREVKLFWIPCKGGTIQWRDCRASLKRKWPGKRLKGRLCQALFLERKRSRKRPQRRLCQALFVVKHNDLASARKGFPHVMSSFSSPSEVDPQDTATVLGPRIAAATCSGLHCGCLCAMSTKVESNLVDSASSHTLVSKIKPCMSKYKRLIL